MWIAKFVYKHDCILGNRCQEYKISLQSIGFSVYKEKSSYINSSLHYMQGEKQDEFIEDLKKENKVLKLERKNNMFFLLEKATKKAAKYFTPKIIFVKPVLMDEKGFETWEIASWDKNELNNFIDNAKREIENFKLIKMINSDLDNVFFPRLLPNLTEKQKFALDLAISNGYYNNPKQTDLRTLAKLMGVSLSTYSQHLAVAESKTLPNLFSYFK